MVCDLGLDINLSVSSFLICKMGITLVTTLEGYKASLCAELSSSLAQSDYSRMPALDDGAPHRFLSSTGTRGPRGPRCMGRPILM